MPINPKCHAHLEQLSREARLREPNEAQKHWYLCVGQYCRDKQILDIGSGTGYGLALLHQLGASSSLGTDPLPVGPGVTHLDPAVFSDATFDVVIAIDVIEHVDDGQALLAEMLRLARELVFFSTPIWNGREFGPYHVREYTPTELISLLAPYRYRAWSCGDGLAEPVPVRTWPIAHLLEAQHAVGILIRKNAGPLGELTVILQSLLQVTPHTHMQAVLEAVLDTPLIKLRRAHTDGKSQLTILTPVNHSVVILPHCRLVVTHGSTGKLATLEEIQQDPKIMTDLAWPWNGSDGEDLSGFFVSHER